MARKQAGEPDRYQARFTGRFDLAPEDADLLELDTELMVVARVRVDSDAEKLERNGDRVWTGVLGIREAGLVVSPQLITRIYEELRLGGDPQLPFYELQNAGSSEPAPVEVALEGEWRDTDNEVREVAAPPVGVDVETGEVFNPDAGRLPVGVGANSTSDPALQRFLEE